MANPVLTNGLGSPQSIYEFVSSTGTNQSRASGTHPVGTRAALDDGRVFYYASNGATAQVAGSLNCVPATVGLNRSADHDKIVLTASYLNFAAGVSNPILSEADLDTSDIIQDEYADGYLSFQDVTGQGHTHKIRNHDSFDASGSDATRRVHLADPIVVSAAATSQISFARNPYDRVIAGAGAEEEAPVGVAPIAVTGSTALATDVDTAVSDTTTYFFWMQTWGPCAVAATGTTIASGVAVTAGSTAGAVTEFTTTNTSMLQIGVGLQSVTAAGDYVLVDLRIRP